jgi:NAD(P)-dependent dehydrogenase (short-subunit alcohol dehydrogenase family)
LAGEQIFRFIPPGFSYLQLGVNPEIRLHVGFFPGKVALITGGSRGIGAAAVRLFGLRARVLPNYQKQSRADALVKECGDETCAAVSCDLTGLDSAKHLVDETAAI